MAGMVWAALAARMVEATWVAAVGVAKVVEEVARLGAEGAAEGTVVVQVVVQKEVVYAVVAVEEIEVVAAAEEKTVAAGMEGGWMAKGWVVGETVAMRALARETEVMEVSVAAERAEGCRVAA